MSERLGSFHRRAVRFLLLWALAVIGVTGDRATAQPATFAGNAQHTGTYEAPAQPLNKVRWSTVIDLANSGASAHYGAPLITSSNTVLVPIKTASGFKISAFEGGSGRLKYTITNDFIRPTLPTNGWVSVYQPVIATPPSGARLYYAGAGGTVFHVDNIDFDTPGAAVRECFYTNATYYESNVALFNSNIFLNTPITADTNGVVFFGFRVEGTAAAPLATTNSGFARIDPAGAANYVLAGAAANDTRISLDSHNCAPALSADGSTVYVGVKDTSSFYGYLLGLDSVTMATKYRVRLRDPRNNNNAGLLESSTASPMVGPDGDVFFGVFSNPNNGSRGFLLHFGADLQTQKTPSGFGWDYTAAIVPTNIVAGYHGTSAYLLFGKYNNYAGTGDGDGINKIALLDPNATQVDPHSNASGLVEMREVLTVIGCAPDQEYQGTAFPFAVREWCINAAAVNPATKSVFAPSEDGRIYRWDLATDSLTEVYTVGPGLGSPYVPTVIGPDGTVYTLNGGKLFALGSFTNVAIGVYSSAPNLRSGLVGDSVTFTAVVTNLDSSGPAPTGTVTFKDATFQGLTPITNVLAAGVPLTDGVAMVTTSSLTARSNIFGNHFITATYSGDGTFQGGSAALVQKVHARATTATVSSSAPAFGAPVTFTATVSSSPAGGGRPGGMVSFWDGSNFLAQAALKTNGTASFTSAVVGIETHPITAHYFSDTVFAASVGNLVVTPPNLTGTMVSSNGSFRVAFSNMIGAPFTVLGSSDLLVPLSNWSVLGPAAEVVPGQFQFNDAHATNFGQRFYRVRSP